jgi:hypothetical protein
MAVAQSGLGGIAGVIRAAGIGLLSVEHREKGFSSF